MLTEIDVDLPVRTVYDQWTQFEDFPLFMRYVDEVHQLDDTTLRWKVSIYGITREWDAEITEQAPDQRIAWTAVDGTDNGGVVTFHPLSDDKTRVVLQLEMDAEGFLEQVAEKGGIVSDRAEKDLQAFKEFIEKRGRATGAWRDDVKRDPDRDAIAYNAHLSEMNRAELVEEAKRRELDGDLENMGRPQLLSALRKTQVHDETTTTSPTR